MGLMYKFIGLAMLGVFAMMVIPGNIDTPQNYNLAYGMANIVKNDNQGNEIFQQSVHNQLVDQGEDLILDSVFADGNAPLGDTVSFGAICVTQEAIANANAATEDDTAASFDTANTLDDQDVCEDSTTVTTSGSIATIGPITFDAGGVNVDNGDTINGIGICQKDTDNSGDTIFANCAAGGAGTSGSLLAAVGTSAVTLNAGETVVITYTFNLVSGTS